MWQELVASRVLKIGSWTYIELLAAEANDVIAFSDPYGGHTTKHTVVADVYCFYQ